MSSRVSRRSVRSTAPIKVDSSDVDNDEILLIDLEDESPPTSHFNSLPSRTMTASDYKSYTKEQHVLEAPEMYIGSTVPIEREEHVMYEGRIQLAQVSVAPAIINLFYEALANAVDNVRRSEDAGVHPGVIAVTMDETTITVYNEGLPIPVVEKEELGVFVPTMVFGQMYTSSNYTQQRNGIGRNGLGANAINLWSTDYSGSVRDSINRKEFYQHWSSNMSVADEPVITEYSGSQSSVEVSYTLDWKRLNMTGYPEEAFYIIEKMCINASYGCKVPVYFNDKLYNCASPYQRARLEFGEFSNFIIHYEWPPGTKTRKITYSSSSEQGGSSQSSKNDVDYREVAVDGRTRPLAEMILADVPNHGDIYSSFVNGGATPEGGIHVEAAIKASMNKIISFINEGSQASKSCTSSQSSSSNKAKASSSSKPSHDSKSTSKQNATSKDTPKITLKDVRSHIALLISVNVTNPVWNNQTKTKLNGPRVSIKIPDSTLSKIKKWNLVDHLKAILKARRAVILKKTDGKKVKFIANTRFQDANDAGGPHSQDCTLALVEGESAEGYVVVLLRFHPKGRDRIGVGALRGKLLNAINSSPEKLAKNNEIIQIKECLGLEEGVDYTIQSNFRRLRYGSLMMVTDRDVDGIHIQGLILTYFMEYFPSLIKAGFIINYLTPYLRVHKGSQTLKFFFEREYLAWKTGNDDWRSWRHKYFKGLGSSTTEDVQDDYRDLHIVNITHDSRARESINLAFNSERSDDRKRLIETWDPSFIPPSYNEQSITDFVHNDLVAYPVACLTRHIPALDGLKQSQRKVLYASFLHWGRSKVHKEYKISQLASFTAEKTNYHHGDSLPNVITMMAHDFVGSNNLPFFTQKSMLGTRNEGGKDASKPRYTFTTPNWWLPYVFKTEDNDLLTYLEDDGESVEPAFYLPIIPLHLINRTNGIAMGYSTFIPNHHPLDVVEWLEAKLQGLETRSFTPWYRGFQGDIEVIDRQARKARSKPRNKQPVQDEIELVIDSSSDEEIMITVDEESDGETEQQTRVRKGRRSMVTRGVFTTCDNTITVTELPIGVWTDDYRKWLHGLRVEKRISDCRNLSDDIKVHFEITGWKPSKPNEPTCHKTLGLRKSYGMSNMNILDENGRPQRYESVDHAMTVFFNFRLPYYRKRLDSNIQKLNSKLVELKERERFISSVVAKDIVIIRGDGSSRNRSDIFRDMDSFNIDRKHIKISSDSYTTDEISSLRSQIAKLEEELNHLQTVDPKTIWLSDLQEFKKAYSSRYRNDREKVQNATSHVIVYKTGKDGRWKSSRSVKPHQSTPDEEITIEL